MFATVADFMGVWGAVIVQVKSSSKILRTTDKENSVKNYDAIFWPPWELFSVVCNKIYKTFDIQMKFAHLKGALESNLVTFAHLHLTCTPMTPMAHPKSRRKVKR